MKLDATVIVGANNELVQLRGPFYELLLLTDDYFALKRRDPRKQLYVGRSFANQAGDEVLFEQLAPRTLEYLKTARRAPTMAKVEVWHRNRNTDLPDEGTVLSAASFTQVGQFLLLPGDDEDLLEEAYGCSQNLNHPWAPRKQGVGYRSTSVCDVLVLTQPGQANSTAYQVLPVGFEPVTFQR